MPIEPARLILGPLIAGTQPFGDRSDPYPDATVISAPWERAVREAGAEPPPALAEAVAWELASLWHDLDTAQRHACNGVWSVTCEDITRRIVVLTRLSAVTPWERIQVRLLIDGVYQGILTAANIEFTEPDMDVVREMHQQIQSGSVPVYEPPG